MTYRVRRHVEVERDILDSAAWIARDSREAAERFLDSAESPILSLRTSPNKGSLKPLGGRLKGVRTWAIRGFPNHLILYMLREPDVVVLAVVHGVRRYRRLLQDRAKQQ